MNLRRVLLASSLLLITSPAFAADFSGTWCRHQHSNKPLDIIWVNPSGEINTISLSEGWDGAKYSKGIASVAGNTLTATLQGEQTGRVIHAIMTMSGNRLLYRSFRDNQTTSYWKGEYQRCHKP